MGTAIGGETLSSADVVSRSHPSVVPPRTAMGTDEHQGARRGALRYPLVTAEYWRRTAIDGVIISAGLGVDAYYPSQIPLHRQAEFLNGRDLYGELAHAARKRGWQCWPVWTLTIRARVSSVLIRTGSLASSRDSPIEAGVGTRRASIALTTLSMRPA